MNPLSAARVRLHELATCPTIDEVAPLLKNTHRQSERIPVSSSQPRNQHQRERLQAATAAAFQEVADAEA